MRRIAISVLVLCAALFGAWQGPANAQSTRCDGSVGPRSTMASGGECPSSGGAAPTWNPNSTQAAMVNQSFGTGATFSVTLDATPSASDVIVVPLWNDQYNFVYFTGITVNGVAATFVGDSSGNAVPTMGGNTSVQLWRVSGVTSASLSIVTTSSAGGVSNEGVIVGVLKNLISSTPTATGFGPSGAQADPQTLGSAITVPSSGFGIVAMGTGASATESPTSGNSTFSTGMNIGGGGTSLFSFYQSTAGSWNPAITGSPSTSFNAGLVAATWH